LVLVAGALVAALTVLVTALAVLVTGVVEVSGAAGLGVAAMALVGAATAIASSDAAAANNRKCLRRSPTSPGRIPGKWANLSKPI
jgi:hypothetical protein